MNLRLYAAKDAWLMVPDCMLASKAAMDKYGPLEYLGEVDQAELEEEELERIVAEFDAAPFAIVAKQMAQRLLNSPKGPNA